MSSGDRSVLLAVATRTELFSAEEADSLLGGVLDALAARTLAEGSAAFACRLSPGTPACGWTYLAPDAHAAGVWNLWWLGVEPAAQGTGAATALLRHAEAHALARGARLMIIETSSLDSQARARRFYAREGYSAVGQVPEFYGPGDHKVIFCRRLPQTHAVEQQSIFELLGGFQGVLRLAHAWHERVLADAVVAHAFSHGFHPQHTERLAAYWTEAWGGPALYTTRLGSESSVVRMHSGNGEHDEMDRRAIGCFADALNDVGIDDPDLRHALLSYFTWAATDRMASFPDKGATIPEDLTLVRWSLRGRQ